MSTDPALHLPALNYACVHCGDCCRMFEVAVEPGRELAGTVLRPDGLRVLQRDSAGCVHLARSGPQLCTVYSDRPDVCRAFPFAVRRTPGGDFVGASFACTAVANGLGPPVSPDRPWNDYPRPPDQQPVELFPGQPAPWELYLEVETLVDSLLEKPGGLWTAAFAVTLAARSGRWDQLGGLPLSAVSPAAGEAAERTLRGLLALCEAGGENERARQVLTALAGPGDYLSRIFPGSATPTEIWPRLDGDDPLWPETLPFFRHLLFRKFLWGAPGVHARVACLPLLHEMLKYWSWQQALVEDRDTPGPDHRRRAVRELERRITFHGQGWEDYIRPLGLALLEGVS